MQLYHSLIYLDNIYKFVEQRTINIRLKDKKWISRVNCEATHDLPMYHGCVIRLPMMCAKVSRVRCSATHDVC